MTGLTRALGAYIAAPDFGPRANEALEVARQGMADTIAVSFAGMEEQVTRIAQAYVRKQPWSGTGTAPAWFTGQELSAPQAAFVNGVASHALDYDDVALSGHPSTALTPAILAQGHVLGASGEECLRAYVVGYETWAELISRDPDPYHIKGWHPTGVFGTIGATAALAYMLRLDAQVAARALAIAGSLAGGLVANFGTMTKPLHSGRAGSLAFEAVELAQLGLTAADDALEHHAGFLAALSPHGKADLERPATIGQQIRLLENRLSIKKYPVCFSGHRIIDATIDIAREQDVDPTQVARAVVGMSRPQASMLRNAAPVTALEAKFSAQFAVASALVRHKVGLQELDDDFVNQPEMRALYGKVEVELLDALDPQDSAFSLHDTVVIEMKDGRRYESGEIRYARGHAHLPLPEADQRAKFDECLDIWQGTAGTELAAALPRPGVLYDRLLGLAQVDDVRTLFKA